MVWFTNASDALKGCCVLSLATEMEKYIVSLKDILMEQHLHQRTGKLLKGHADAMIARRMNVSRVELWEAGLLAQLDGMLTFIPSENGAGGINGPGKSIGAGESEMLPCRQLWMLTGSGYSQAEEMIRMKVWLFFLVLPGVMLQLVLLIWMEWMQNKRKQNAW